MLFLQTHIGNNNEQNLIPLNSECYWTVPTSRKKRLDHPTFLLGQYMEPYNVRASGLCSPDGASLVVTTLPRKRGSGMT